MSDETDDLRDKLNQFKPKKKKLTIPKELLEGAHNYDEKLGVIKIVTEKEMKKVILLIKGMLAEDRNNKK
jgi:cobalamin biosynthesis Co2+ chelatase CbiK